MIPFVEEEPRHGAKDDNITEHGQRPAVLPDVSKAREVSCSAAARFSFAFSARGFLAAGQSMEGKTPRLLDAKKPPKSRKSDSLEILTLRPNVASHK